MSTVPVYMGSPRFTTLEVDAELRVLDAWFPPDALIPLHAHDRVSFSAMLEGSFLDRIGRRDFRCEPATVFTHPAREPHENRIGSAGAHMVLVQPDAPWIDAVEPVREVLEDVRNFRSGEISGLARQLGAEVRHPDESTPLQAESLVLEMLGIAAGIDPDADQGRIPAWLDRARDLIHDRFLDAPTVGEIADAVGVHRVHLSRSFRSHYHAPVGTYIRRLRLEWAATRLREGKDSISSIAFRAGFANQSHLTSAFKVYLGTTPGAYRAGR